MHKRFRQVFCALKEHTSVSYAKIATFGGFCDVDLIIVKATAPDDLPLPEKYMHELVKIFSFSNSSFHSFSLSFTRRFGNTRSWKVALNASFSSTACSGHCLKIALFGQNYYGLDPMACSLSIHVISETIHLQILKLTPCLLGPTRNYSTNLLIAFPWTTRQQRKK
jgi:hypothetical protein